jgi:hypothetical protein
MLSCSPRHLKQARRQQTLIKKEISLTSPIRISKEPLHLSNRFPKLIPHESPKPSPNLTIIKFNQIKDRA